MPYDALTIDTNLVKQEGLNLEGGLLAQLKQFKDGPVDFVLSEIVILETEKHLVEQVKNIRDKLASAVGRIEDVQLATGAEAAELKARIDALGDPKAVARSRLKAFFEATGAMPVPAKYASMSDLVRGYFKASAPFDPSGAKKHEFPDAIALLSLEGWAKETQKKVLAVSGDKGWAQFAETSEWIDVEADFAKALQVLQEHAEEARIRVADVLSRVEAGALEDIAEVIKDGLGTGLSEWMFMAEGHGSFYLEVYATELVLGDYTFSKVDDQFDITIVRLGNTEVVARIGVSVSATATAEFSLSNYDSIDKDMVQMGSEAAESEVEFDGAILVTLLGDLAGDLGELEAYGVEVVEAIDSVDFGEIEFSPDYDDYEDWLMEADQDPGIAVAEPIDDHCTDKPVIGEAATGRSTKAIAPLRTP